MISNRAVPRRRRISKKRGQTKSMQEWEWLHYMWVSLFCPSSCHLIQTLPNNISSNRTFPFMLSIPIEAIQKQGDIKTVIDRLADKFISKKGELIASEKAEKGKNLLGLMSE
jgi:hypothetical protein